MRNVTSIVLGSGITILETPRGWRKTQSPTSSSTGSPGNVSRSKLGESEEMEEASDASSSESVVADPGLQGLLM